MGKKRQRKNSEESGSSDEENQLPATTRFSEEDQEKKVKVSLGTSIRHIRQYEPASLAGTKKVKRAAKVPERGRFWHENVHATPIPPQLFL